MKTAYWLIGIVLVAIIFFHLGKYSNEVKLAEPQPLKEVAAQTGGIHLFSKVIESTSRVNMLPFNDADPAHHQIRKLITEVGTDVSLEMSQIGSAVRENRRINEASRHFEDALREKIDAHEEFTCSIPKTKEGKEQRSGYPDLRIEHLTSKTVVFLDPKLFEEKSRKSSFRTFYYEPGKTNKVTEDAIHLLVGFPHDGKTRQWTFGKPEIVDLFHLKVKLKTEFSASNRELYDQ